MCLMHCSPSPTISGCPGVDWMDEVHLRIAEGDGLEIRWPKTCYGPDSGPRRLSPPEDASAPEPTMATDES